MAIERVNSFFGGKINISRELQPGKSFIVNNLYNDSGDELIHKRTTVKALSSDSVEVTEFVKQYLIDGKRLTKEDEENEDSTSFVLKRDEINLETTACFGELVGWKQLYRYKPSEGTESDSSDKSGKDSNSTLKSSKIEKIARKIGILPSEEKQLEIDRLYVEDIEAMKARNKENDRIIHQLVNHSNACTSEIEYLLGMSNYDPHPNRPVAFDECTHTDEEIFGYPTNEVSEE